MLYESELNICLAVHLVNMPGILIEVLLRVKKTEVKTKEKASFCSVKFA